MFIRSLALVRTYQSAHKQVRKRILFQYIFAGSCLSRNVKALQNWLKKINKHGFKTPDWIMKVNQIQKSIGSNQIKNPSKQFKI